MLKKDCFICKQIREIREGRNKFFICELEFSYVVLSDAQVYPGYALVYLKEHKESHERLTRLRQVQFFSETAHVGRMIQSELKPVRINYAEMGNTVAHVHWHVIPRYKDDPAPTRPIWERPSVERKKPATKDQLIELIPRLRKCILAR